MAASVVVDASIIVPWLLTDPRTEAVRALFVRSDLEIMAPEMLSLEVANVLTREVRRGALLGQQADMVWRVFRRAPIVFTPDGDLAPIAFDAARVIGCTACDGVYVALADRLRTRLVTLDARLVRGVTRTRFEGSVVDLADFA